MEKSLSNSKLLVETLKNVYIKGNLAVFKKVSNERIELMYKTMGK